MGVLDNQCPVSADGLEVALSVEGQLLLDESQQIGPFGIALLSDPLVGGGLDAVAGSVGRALVQLGQFLRSGVEGEAMLRRRG